jgi:hypothetical protein
MGKHTGAMFLIVFFFSPLGAATAGILGDINNDGRVDLQEALYALRIAAGVQPDIPVSRAVVGKGDWTLGESYTPCDVVKHEGSFYICTQGHVST